MIYQYQICKKCIMDTTDPKIEFDENNICNHCKEYNEKIEKRVFTGKAGKQILDKLVEDIRKKGKNKEYNCIVGVSGGIDSTYLIHWAKQRGLRPLVVHMDNGWNTKIATRNITKILKKLDIDLYTYVIDWEEFRDIQLAYLKASVMDTEVVTDHAIKAVLYKVANERNIKYILSGVNLQTEGVMASSWGHNKNDYKNLLDIHNKFGKVKLKTYPILPLTKRIYYQIFRNIQMIEVFNYINYNKEKIKKLLSEKYGWEDYGRKHRESMFTHFFQEYILPRKFNIDKRKAHLSSLICAGQITREEALKEMTKPLYPEEELKKDKEYVLKKFGLSEEEFEKIMDQKPKSHYDYKSNDKFLRNLRATYKVLFRR